MGPYIQVNQPDLAFWKDTSGGLVGASRSVSPAPWRLKLVGEQLTTALKRLCFDSLGYRCILPETNIFAPENGWLEDYFPFGKAYFQGLC